MTNKTRGKVSSITDIYVIIHNAVSKIFLHLCRLREEPQLI